MKAEAGAALAAGGDAAGAGLQTLHLIAPLVQLFSQGAIAAAQIKHGARTGIRGGGEPEQAAQGRQQIILGVGRGALPAVVDHGAGRGGWITGHGAFHGTSGSTYGCGYDGTKAQKQPSQSSMLRYA